MIFSWIFQQFAMLKDILYFFLLFSLQMEFISAAKQSIEPLAVTVDDGYAQGYR